MVRHKSKSVLGIGIYSAKLMKLDMTFVGKMNYLTA